MAPPVDRRGIWGNPTSTLDWCEENYVVTPYLAEFWNTVSNIIMILPPFISTIYYWRKGVEARYLLTFLAFLTVGIGSWMFHMTLRYEMQLLDELPMIYGTCIILYAMRHHTTPQKYQNISHMAGLAFCSVVVTIVYLQWRNPLFHQASYGFLVFGLVYEAIYAMKKFPPIRTTVIASLSLYLLGFLLWNIDNFFCSSLRNIRENSGQHSVLQVATQFHAWWHIFTGFATYLQIMFSCHARTLHLKRTCSVQKFGGVWPYLDLPKVDPHNE